MAYVTPPTFVDGNVLSAAQLNILSDDIEYLHGVTDTPNFGFVLRGASASTILAYYIRHKHRYLHYRYRIETHDANEVQIEYGGEMIDADMVGAIGTYSGYYDLDSYGFTVNDWYQVSVIYTSSSNSYITVDYLLEADTTTI